MSDIIPLEVPRWAQYRVYILQVMIWTIAKALNSDSLCEIQGSD
jgi:hypothetical protein